MSKVILIDSSGLFVPTVKVWGRLRQGQVQTGTPSFVMPAHCMSVSYTHLTLPTNREV